MNVEIAHKDTPCEMSSLKSESCECNNAPDMTHLIFSVDMLCAELDSELCSIFTYDVITKRLVSIVSKDIKGLSIPIDKGIAGMVFRLGQVINVEEIKSDPRHNCDIDNQMKYITQSLLCAPIIGANGKPIGVIQALNKKGLSHFTKHDEILMCRCCTQLSSSFRGTDYLSNCSNYFLPGLVQGYLDSLASLKSLQVLMNETQKIITSTVVCDFVGFYTFSPGVDSTADQLVCENYLLNKRIGNKTNEPLLFTKDLSLEILNAFKKGIMTEFSASLQPLEINTVEDFPPRISIQHALIYPLTRKFVSNCNLSDENVPSVVTPTIGPASTILIVIRTFENPLPFSYAVRDVLDLFVAMLGICIERDGKGETEHPNHQEKLNNSDKSLDTEEYIMLLGSNGDVLSTNKDLRMLFGSDQDGGSLINNTDDSFEVKCDRQTSLKDIDGQGHNFSFWFQNSSCPELIADIINALSIKHTFEINNTAKFVSSMHQSGANIDYRLLSVASHTERDEDRCGGIILVIQIKNDLNKMNGISLKRPLDEVINVDGEALQLIESATKQLKSVVKNYELSSEMQLNLNIITSGLDDLICTGSDSISTIVNDMNTSNTPTTKRWKSYSWVGLSDSEIEITQDIFSWDFNVLEINDNLVLVNVIGKIFGALHFQDDLGINATILANYVREVASKYPDNPFHNLQHATCVTHFVYMLICTTDANKYLSPNQLFAVVLSALVHDVDHPGNTNMYEVNTSSNLAVLYNDKSVLENHHCSVAFQLMRKDSTNIFRDLSKSVALELRKIVVTCVLATDMTEHFGLVDKTKRLIAGGDYNFNEINDKLFLCSLLVHSADLSNPIRPFHMTLTWARRISDEFNAQVAKERELDLPVLSFMLTTDEKSLCKNEIVFNNFVVAPMWRSNACLFPSLLPLVHQLDSNSVTFKSMLEIIMREEDALEQTVLTP